MSAFKDGLEVIVPQPLTIRVPITGYPTPVARWTFREKELSTADERVSLMTKSTFTELMVTPSVRPDKGIYTLHLENDVTSVSGEIEVNVIGTPLKIFKKKKSLTVLKIFYQNDVIGFLFVFPAAPSAPKDFKVLEVTRQHVHLKPPEIQLDAKLLAGLTAKAGSKIELPAEVKGKPEPRVKWTKADLVLKPDDRVSIDTKPGHSTVTVAKTKRDDSSTYIIEATNSSGRATATVDVNILVAPIVEVDVKLTEGIIVKAGTTIRLPAIMRGIPVPTAKWSIEGEEITSQGNIKIDTDNFSTVLNINECTRNHTGTYLLAVSNPAGTKTVALNVTVLDVPAAPIGPVNILEVTPDSMTIEWRPPKDDGGSAVTNYIVEKRESTKETWGGVSSGSIATKLRITRLQRGVEYVLRIRAENKMGIGAPLESKPTVAEHSFMPPSPPGKPQSSDISEDAVTLGWTMPLSDGGSQISGYIIERRHKGGKWIRVNKTPCKDLRYRVLGLFEGSEYEFRVFAENIAGYSGPSPISDSCKPCRPITVPSPPVNPKVKDYSKVTADLVWTKPTKDGGSPILGYTVEMKKGDAEEWKKVNVEDLIKQCAYRVKGLEEGVTYRFRVSASNMIGDGEPREIPESITAQDILIPPEIEMEATCRDCITVRVGHNINIMGLLLV
uniref:Titin n=1 Tax=Amphilophus citrinellus TaxID=61819 RepID=A0A3Q0QVV1_AMPCI